MTFRDHSGCRDLTDPGKATGLVNDTTRLLGLDGVEVTSVRLEDDANPLDATEGAL